MGSGVNVSNDVSTINAKPASKSVTAPDLSPEQILLCALQLCREDRNNVGLFQILRLTVPGFAERWDREERQKRNAIHQSYARPQAVYATRRLGEENSGTSGYLLCLFILLGLLATYLVARVFYRALKPKLANLVRAAEDLSD